MRKRLVVVGAGGFGRECVSQFRAWNGFADRFEIRGFLDDRPDALDGFAGYPPILSSVGDYVPRPDDVFVCAIGTVARREGVIAGIEARGGRFETLVAPNAVVSDTAEIGGGALILGCAQVSANAKIGRHVLLNFFVDVGHDVAVGDGSVLEAFTFCGGFARVGNRVTLHTRSTVLPGVRIGDGAVVGAGSVVILNVRPGEKVFGNPAKKFRL